MKRWAMIDEVPTENVRASTTSGLRATWLCDWNEGSAPIGNTERVRITLQQYTPGGDHKPHQHESLEQVYIMVKGTGRMHIGDEEFDAVPGMMIYVPAKTDHYIVNIGDDELVHYLININLGDEKPPSDPRA